MRQQANLNFLGNDTLTADSDIVNAIIYSSPICLQSKQIRNKTTFILGATVGQTVMHATLPYQVKQVYTTDDNKSTTGEQIKFFAKDVGKISMMEVLDTGNQVKPSSYKCWTSSSSSLKIDHECFFPTEYIDLCTQLVQPFMIQLATSYHGSQEIVRLWTQLCGAEGDATLLKSIIDELEQSTTQIYKSECVIA